MSTVAVPAFPEAPVGLGRDLVVVIAVAVAVVGTFLLAPVSGVSTGAVELESAARVLVAVIPVVVGVYAWHGVPFWRLGTLLVASGGVWLVVTFSLAGTVLAYSVGRVASWVGVAALLYLVLAFPDGRLVGRVDRALAASAVGMLLLLWLPTALLVDRYPEPSLWVTCSQNCPRNAFMVLAHEPGVISQVVVPLRELLVVLLLLAVVVRLAQRIASASKVRRRTLTPVLAVAIAGIVVLAIAIVVRRLSPDSRLLAVLRWVDAFALPAMALAFVAGLLRWRLYVGASLGRFAASVRAPPGPHRLRAAFANAFEDPSLEVVYPVGEGRWAAADGRLADAPVPEPGRAMSELRNANHEVVAALIHDDALRHERAFIHTVASYAALTLENDRLAAEIAHLAREMRETQARAAESADRTREQIERDLHDGAQQRLIALRIKLQLAAERSADDPEGAEQLNKLGGDVEVIIDELRALARGVFNTVLTNLGPAAALRETTRQAPIPTTVTSRTPRRYDPEAERAVYFCCLEALQNAYKHARTATAARVMIAEDGRELTFEVSDDGVGFAMDAAAGGAGLGNMRDRLAALGGSLTIEAAPGRGTRVAGAISLTQAAIAGVRQVWPRKRV